MAAESNPHSPELEALQHKYRSAPDSYVFAPLADAYRKSGRLDEAVDVCRTGTEKHPDYPSGHVVLGKCFFDLGRVEDAHASFRRVLALDANNLVALKYLGMIEAGRGGLDRAREHFGQILVLDPENREIRGMLEDLQAKERPVRGSDREVEDEKFEGETISIGDGDGGTSDELATTTLADIYAAQGYKDKAAKIYSEVLRKQPENEEIKKKLRDLLGDAIVADDIEVDVKDISLQAEPPAEPVDTGERPDETPAREKEPTQAKPASEDETRRSTHEPEDPTGSDRREISDRRSYDQFKRWLKNMQQ